MNSVVNPLLIFAFRMLREAGKKTAHRGLAGSCDYQGLPVGASLAARFRTRIKSGFTTEITEETHFCLSDLSGLCGKTGLAAYVGSSAC